MPSPTAVLFSLALLLVAPAALGQDAPDPRPTPKAEAFVHIETDAPLTLKRLVGRFGEDACAAPCDRVLRFDPTDRFAIAGSFPAAQTFTLGDAGPRVRLRVDTGSHAGTYGGVVLMAVGAAAPVISGFVFILAVVGDALGSGNGVEDRIKYGTLGAAIGGGVALAAGIPLLVLSQTTVEVVPDPQRGAARGLVTFRF